MINLSNTPTETTNYENRYKRIMPLADYLGLHHQTVRRYIKQGKIPTPKVVNGVQLFDMTEIDAWLETGQVTPSDDKGGLNNE